MNLQTRCVVVALEYVVKLNETPLDNISEIARILKKGSLFPFNCQDALTALNDITKNPEPVAHLLHQPHSDDELHEYFKALKKELETNPATLN